MNKKTFTMIPTNNDEFYSKSEKLEILHLYIVERVRGFENNKLTCYISNEQLAQETNSSVSTIKRAIKMLVELNILWAGYHQEGMKNKQRILRVYNSAVQNEPERGSNCTPERFKLTPSEVQNEPLVYYKQTNNKLLIESGSKEKKRKLEELSNLEANEIIDKLKNGEKYIDIQKQYNLEFGSVTKNFKTDYEKAKNDIRAMHEQEELEKHKSDYEYLQGCWCCNSANEAKSRANAFLSKYPAWTIEELVSALQKNQFSFSDYSAAGQNKIKYIDWLNNNMCAFYGNNN